MAKITIEELSDSLKEYLDGLGLTEEQVNSLVQNKLGDLSSLETVNKDNIVNSVNEVKDTVAFVGTAIFGSDMSDDTLMTDSNTVIGAINELFQSANSGKELIANAIGNPLITGDSTFNAMSEAILELKKESENETDAKEVLYNMMIEDGYNEATSDMTADELIDLLDRSGIEIGDIKQIACGDSHTVILKNDGSVWVCGLNNNGQLGLDNTNNKITFTQVTTNIDNDVKQVACGRDHTFILKNNGSIWGCGKNTYGQLGLGVDDTNNRYTFTQVIYNVSNDVKQIVCGGYSTFILKNDGSLWSCGHNGYGQLGLGDNTDKTTFTQVTTDISNDVKQVACGRYHTVILKNDGSIWSCGYNADGQLGLGVDDTNNRYTFTQTIYNINNDVKQVACGFYSTFILKNDSSIWSCGLNDYGQLGLGDTTNRTTFTQVKMHFDIKQIASGNEYSVVLTNDGDVYSCGRNNYGQLGTDFVTSFNNVFNKANSDVKQIACGNAYTFILKIDGTVWSCGDNLYGQLGLNNSNDKTTFTNTNFTTGVPEYDIDKSALFSYLLSNDIPVNESMDIETMLNLLVDDNTNNTTLGYATGEGSVTFIVTTESKPRNATLDKPFGFTPTHIILVFDNGAILTNKTTSNNPLELNTENYIYIDSMTSDTLTFKSFSGMNQYSHDFIYYAFDANSSSSESGTGSNILSYETLELSSSDLYIPTNSDSDYYHYSLSDSYNDDDVYLVFADTKAMEDDIGYMQYYTSLYFSPDMSAAHGSILLGHDSGGEADSVTQMSAHARIPIMKTTDRLLESKLVVLYRAGAVSNAFSQSLLNTEPATYQLIEYRTFDLDSLSFDFDYILFSLSVNNGDGDSSTIYSMYDRNSKKCCIMAHGYDTYSYKFDDVPSNAIPIIPTNRYSGLFVSYTGFVKNGNNIRNLNKI